MCWIAPQDIISEAEELLKEEETEEGFSASNTDSSQGAFLPIDAPVEEEVKDEWETPLGCAQCAWVWGSTRSMIYKGHCKGKFSIVHPESLRDKHTNKHVATS